MKLNRRVVGVVLPLLLSASGALAQSVGTAFVYQGKLSSGSTFVNAAVDMRFRLFDAATGGTQVGPTLCVDNVQPVDGLFHANLDFGAQFNGQGRFLQIEVRGDASAACGVDTQYVTLAPRQRLSATPYAAYALSGNPGPTGPAGPAGPAGPQGPQGPAGASPFGLTSGNAVLASGNLGVGITNPYNRVDVPNGSFIGSSQTVGGLFNGLENRGTKIGLGYSFLSDCGNAFDGMKVEVVPGPFCGNSADITFFTEACGVSCSREVMRINGSGQVGIGTSTPGATFHVVGSGLVTGLMTTGSLSTGAVAGAGATFTGRVGVGTNNPQTPLDVNGRTRTRELEIIGGADIVEGFNTMGEAPEAGTLMVIDEANPGQIKPSTGAYDTKVAGVVSGAGGVNAGIKLGHEGVLDGDVPVAMTGRVYVKCTTGNGPIKPGDLLTTSDIVGHAMKATDRERANGATIGKAMTGLESGDGLVLVLVNLQ